MFLYQLSQVTSGSEQMLPRTARRWGCSGSRQLVARDRQYLLCAGFSAVLQQLPHVKHPVACSWLVASSGASSFLSNPERLLTFWLLVLYLLF